MVFFSFDSTRIFPFPTQTLFPTVLVSRGLALLKRFGARRGCHSSVSIVFSSSWNLAVFFSLWIFEGFRGFGGWRFKFQTSRRGFGGCDALFRTTTGAGSARNRLWPGCFPWIPGRRFSWISLMRSCGWELTSLGPLSWLERGSLGLWSRGFRRTLMCLGMRLSRSGVLTCLSCLRYDFSVRLF